MSFIQQLDENVDSYERIKVELEDVLVKLQSKINIYKELYTLKKDEKIKKDLDDLQNELKDFIMVVDIVSTTDEVYNKKVIQTKQEVKDSISDEIWSTVRLAFIVIVLFL